MTKFPAIQCGLLLSLISCLCQGVAAANSVASDDLQNNIENQRLRQIARQVSSAISSRVAAEIDPAAAKQNSQAAAADGTSYLPDSLWSTFSWSNISQHPGTTPFNVNLYQTTSGVDKRIGDVFLGVSVVYAGTSTDINGAGQAGSGSNNLVGFTPYLAYLLNQNFYISSMTGYNSISDRFDDNQQQTQTRADADAYKFELALNGLHTIKQWFFNGKIGARFQHTDTQRRLASLSNNTLGSNQTTSDVMTYLSSVEAGYAFQNGPRIYSGFYYEYATISHGSDNGVLFFHAGADVQLTQKLSLGAKVQNDLNNQQADIATASLNLRLLLD